MTAVQCILALAMTFATCGVTIESGAASVSVRASVVTEALMASGEARVGATAPPARGLDA
ncbi:MAG: hypothetical protein IPK20_00470 [Betaproteobacteria bacterium]|nr:hypothetical protein [Betaproteobacteria bacterium]